MIINLEPKFYNYYSNVTVELVDIFIPEMNITLTNDKDVVVRKPYPNKKYLVACRKKGQKAIKGLLIDAKEDIKFFTVVTRWLVDNEISIHKVHYYLNDNELNAATDNISRWRGLIPFVNKKLVSCENEEQKNWNPTKDQVCMFPDCKTSKSQDSSRNEAIFELEDTKGYIRERTEYFTMPTCEMELIFDDDRAPAITDAFISSVNEYADTLIPNSEGYWGVHVILIKEWVAELKIEFNEDAYLDKNVFLFNVLDEISKETTYFYSNSNDLMNKALSYSSTYNNGSDEFKEHLKYEFNNTIFSIEYD